jgi:hypothetical protein
MWPIYTSPISRKTEPNKMANEFWSKAHCYQQWAEERVLLWQTWPQATARAPNFMQQPNIICT